MLRRSHGLSLPWGFCLGGQSGLDLSYAFRRVSQVRDSTVKDKTLVHGSRAGLVMHADAGRTQARDKNRRKGSVCGPFKRINAKTCLDRVGYGGFVTRSVRLDRAGHALRRAKFRDLALETLRLSRDHKISRDNQSVLFRSDPPHSEIGQFARLPLEDAPLRRPNIGCILPPPGKKVWR
jgi:hypothetical protein